MSVPVKLSSPSTGEFWEIPVLHEDEHLLVLDKPPNLLTAPDRHNPDRPCLSTLLHEGIRDGKPWATSRNLSFLANAHRLDFEVGGTLVLARNESVLKELSNAFGSEKPFVEFVTLVRGVPRDDTFEVSANLIPDPNRAGLMKTTPQDGKKAMTRFVVLERFRGWALLKCLPLTQRLHQIRVHLKEIRHPLAGDRDYSGRPLLLSSIKPDYRLKPGRRERPLIDSPIIHAQKLSIPHPVSGDVLEIESPWVKELKVAVKYLRQYASA